MNIFALSGFINGALFLLLGVFVFLKNTKSRLNQFFALMCLGGAAWGIPYGFWQMAESEAEALFFLRLLTSGSTLGAFFMGSFVFEALNLTEKKKNILFVFFTGSLIIISLLFTPYLSSGVKELSFYPYWPIAGPVYYFFAGWVFLMVGYPVYFLIKKIRHLRGLERERIKYLLLAIIVWIVGASNNVPQWIGDISFPPYGNFLMFLPPLIISFVTLKYHLFEIKVILTELLVGLMGIILLILPFLEETPQMKILTLVIFLVFCFIGYLLIKSTYRELKAKETLEQKVQERTKELEERTKESEKRAEEIQKRKEDLERFYSLTVGRELKMIELKEKIRELEEKVGE